MSKNIKNDVWAFEHGGIDIVCYLCHVSSAIQLELNNSTILCLPYLLRRNLYNSLFWATANDCSSLSTILLPHFCVFYPISLLNSARLCLPRHIYNIQSHGAWGSRCSDSLCHWDRRFVSNERHFEMIFCFFMFWCTIVAIMTWGANIMTNGGKRSNFWSLARSRANFFYVPA